MKAIVWNIAGKRGSWEHLMDWEELSGADIALLAEAPRPPRRFKAVGDGRTLGLDANLGPERPVSRPWSTYVVGGEERPARITDARVDRYYGEQLPFRASRKGTWVAARLQVGGLPITAISLYGLMDERSDASVHRSLSEMAPLFDHPDYGTYLLLGGDLNILSNPRPNDPARERHRNVLDRIAAYGLVDCLEVKRPRAALPECPCGRGRGCRHTWTKRVKGKATAYQDDYLFASRRLAKRLESCIALPFTGDSPSDHTPIVATFRA